MRKAGHSDTSILNAIAPDFMPPAPVEPKSDVAMPAQKTADYNIVQEAVHRGYSMDEIADRLAKNAGYDPALLRERGYDSNEILLKLGYSAPKPEEAGVINSGKTAESKMPVALEQQIGTTPLQQPDNSHTVAWGVSIAVFVAVALLAWFKFKKIGSATGVGTAAQSPIHEQKEKSYAKKEPHNLQLDATKGNAMNQNQKRILIAVLAIVAAMFVYPPFQIVANNGTVFNMGYGWIFDSPKRGSVIANVNVPMLLIQWIGVLIVGGIAFFIAKSSPQEPRVSGSNAKNENAMSQIESETTMGSNSRPPYEWGSVVIWVMTLFLGGLTTARPLHGSGMDRFALGLMSGIFWAVVGGLIVAVIKHFKRSPKLDSSAALASAKTNDKEVFFGALALAAFFIGMAIYLERYGSLLDAVILVGLGFGVKNGLGFARWLLAAYAFISAIIVVAFGSGNAMIYAIVFYAVCRSIMAHRSVDVAGDMDNKLISSSAPNTALQQQSFSTSTKAAPISSGQRAVQNAPAVAKLADTVQTPPTDAKPTMNNRPPVNAMPSIAIESSPQSMPGIEDRLYEQIAQEIETNAVDKGIWTKVYAQAGGDDKLTRVAYIKVRFEKLMAAENARLEAMQQERRNSTT